MIVDMRWVKRKKIKSGMVSTSKVLQVRLLQAPFRVENHTILAQEGVTEWRDVPIVEEHDGDPRGSNG